MAYLKASTGSIESALAYADKTLALEPAYQAANLLKAQVYLSMGRMEEALGELFFILENRQNWYDYSPFAAQKILNDLQAAQTER
jgi:predicted Zn-dependent protease